MHLKYIFHGQNNKPHPYHVKSNWIPQVQPSVALESYLEEVKLQLAEIKLSQPKNNLSSKEREALQSLKRNKDLNVKKADKGSCVVIMDTENKINEGQTLLDNSKHYRPLDEPMVKETQYKVKQLIQELHENKNIDDMTKKWLSQTPSPPRIPIFYTLTKIPRAPLAFLSRLKLFFPKLPFPSLSNACHAGYHFGKSTSEELSCPAQSCPK